MAVTQYIGARYVPKFYENSLGTSAWTANTAYEPLTIVERNGNSYTSKKPVPANIGEPENNPYYWAATGIFNEQLNEVINKTRYMVVYRNDVTELIADTVLVDGDIVYLMGYHEEGDGGAAYYIITDTEPSEYHITMSNGLYAEFVYTGYVTPEMFGAYGDGLSNDSTAINQAINYENVIFDSDKTYVANIVTPEDKFINLDLCNCAIHGSITVKGRPNITYGDKNRTTICNGNLVCNGSVAILIEDDIYRTVIKDMCITAHTTGIQCGQTGTMASDVFIENCFINAESGNEDSTAYGVNFVNTDNRIVNCRIYGFKTCIKSKSIDYIVGCHFLYRGDFATNWNSAVAIECQGYPFISECYFDTYKTGISFTAACFVNMTACVFYSWRTDTGSIDAFLKTNGYGGSVRVANMTVNDSTATTFKFTDADPTTANGADFWLKSSVSNVFVSFWNKVYEYDLLRTAVSARYYSTQVAANKAAEVGRYFAPITGSYILSLNSVTFGEKYIDLSIGTQATGEVRGDSTFTVTVQRTGKFITVYVAKTSQWVYNRAVNNTQLIAFGENPVIKDPEYLS